MFHTDLIVIWVKRNQLQIHNGRELSQLPLPEDIVSNLEIVNRDRLYGLIQAWVKEKTYHSSQIVWLLDPEITFDQVLNPQKQDLDLDTVKFIDSVPFEAVASRVYLLASGERLVAAANKDILLALVHAFAILGYPSAGEIPAKMFKEIDVTQGLTNQVFHLIDSRMGEIANQRLLVEEEAQLETSPKKSTAPKPKNSSLPLLLGIFGFLVLILVVLLVLR